MGTVLGVEEFLLAQLSTLLSVLVQEAVVIALGAGDIVPEVGITDLTGHVFPLQVILQPLLGKSAVALHAKAVLLTIQEVVPVAIPLVSVDLLSAMLLLIMEEVVAMAIPLVPVDLLMPEWIAGMSVGAA